jgi:signal transduction histidine kinase
MSRISRSSIPFAALGIASVRLPRLVRTISFRLAASYAALFALSTGAVFAFIYWMAGDVLTDQLRTSLRSQAASWAQAGPARSRSRGENDRDAGYYSFQDRSGRKVSGTLPQREPDRGFDLWRVDCRDLEDARDCESEELLLLAYGTRLADGTFLTVAADMRPVREAQQAFLSAFAWSIGATLVIALAGGLAVSRGFLRRIDEINRATRAIMNGDLTDRVRVRPTGDEIHDLARNLNEMLDRLQALIEGIKHVSHNIAHELRTPLSRLKQRLEAAQQEAHSEADYTTAIGQALRDADTALATFSALLRIAQIESGTRRSRFAEVDLSELLSALTDTYTPVAEDLGKTLSTSVAADLRVIGDRELLTQMFANLIENALRHTQPGAAVTLSAGWQDGRIRAQVRDNGPGIPSGERTAVFQAFYRLEASAESGVGLGLALVGAIAELHGVALSLADAAPGLEVTLTFGGAGH